MDKPTTTHPDTLDLPSDRTTDYDMANLLAYARILDVESGRSKLDGADWREGVKIILGHDPDTDEAAARRCWNAHLARARWLVGDGLRHMVEDHQDIER